MPVDNHETHLSIEPLDKASAIGIVVVTFPSRTSRKLQSLDHSVYSPQKTYYNQAVEPWLCNQNGNTIAEALRVAYPRAFTPTKILYGLRKPGTYPFDPQNNTEDDFLSAYVT